jgi:hypothetical protein
MAAFLEGEKQWSISGKETAALPAPVAEPMLVPDRERERVGFEDRVADEDATGVRRRSTRPVVRR